MAGLCRVDHVQPYICELHNFCVLGQESNLTFDILIEIRLKCVYAGYTFNLIIFQSNDPNQSTIKVCIRPDTQFNLIIL